MKNKFIFGTLSAVGLLLVGNFSGLIFAQSVESIDSTQSGESVQTVNDSEIKESIKQRIQDAVRKDLSTDSEPTIKALVGELDSVTDQSLTLIINGLTELLSISENTLIMDESNSSLSVEDLVIGGGVIAISTRTTEGLLTASEIIALDELPAKPDKRSVLAEILEIDGNNIEVEIKPNLESLILTSNRNSLIFQSVETESLDVDDLTTGDEVLAIYSPDIEENTLLKLQLISSVEASPSAQNIRE